MTEDISFLFSHPNIGALVDANLLLVYAVGKVDRRLLPTFHHTKQYAEDYEIIERLVGFLSNIYTTPNILTEVSNLGKKLGEPFFEQLRTIVNALPEKYCISADSVKTASFTKLGLTDAGIMELAAPGLLVVTADWPLFGMLQSRNLPAVNFNHLRQLEWSVFRQLTK